MTQPPATEGATMQTTRRTPAINYGLRAKLGMMLPSSNSVAEPQIAAMLPPGVSLHTTRLRLRSGREALGMLEKLEDAAQLMADAAVDRLIFHCTAVSMHAPEIPAQIGARVAAITSIPLTITSEAVLAALGILGASKIVLMTPYDRATNDREVNFLRHNGIEVLAERGLGIDGGVAMAAVEPETWFRETVALRDPAAEAYFVSCTTIRSADVIEALEDALGKPVITSNQAMLWQALRETGIADPIDGFGRLLRDF
jgi:maleate isomerase